MARVLRVPYSASNLSSNGVNARMLTSAWKKPECMKGKVFRRYTRETDGQAISSSVSGCNSFFRLLVASPISFGISEPHCVTLHTVCNSTIQKTSMMRMHARVKRGRRRIYERRRCGLKEGMEIGAMAREWAFEARRSAHDVEDEKTLFAHHVRGMSWENQYYGQFRSMRRGRLTD